MTARTFQPVRRSSVNAGTIEHRIWRPFDPNSKGPIMKAAEQFERQNRLPGRENGPLGHVGLEVLRELLRLVDHKTGRLDPGYDFLMRRLKRSRHAIARALARLRQHGFLDWVRRTEPVDNDGAGPRVRQVTNAYWVKVPEAVAAFVKRLLGKAPPDAMDRQRAIAAARAERLEAMSARRPGIAAADCLSDEAKASLRRLAERRRSASHPGGLNPAFKG